MIAPPTLTTAGSAVTIGVYGWSAGSFLAALDAVGVTMVYDVRQRRGVRGAEYAWANSQRLQHALVGAHIGYEHHKELAPTTELRHVQYAADARQGVGKRSRAALAPEYRERYLREILDTADLGALAARLRGAGRTALLCVERDPDACHRSLIAERLERDHGVAFTHLLPPE